MEETKDGLRIAALTRRSSLSPATCCSWSGDIQAKAIALPQYLAARSVGLYCAVGNEVDTGALMKHALRHGKRVFCPKFDGGDSPFFARLRCTAALRVGGFGVPEPVGDERLSPEDCEGLIVMVPGVLFDILGNRLGRGGGWYDRALGSLENGGVFVGLAYDWQVVDSLPAQDWDQKVHYVITESRVIDCRGALQSRVDR